MQEIIQEVHEFLSHSVDPIQKRFLFQGRPSEAALNDTPMILMIGNHSSGKSSFINHFIGQDVQLTGMAPTDEDFTILRHGPTEKERPGSSLISNPELGYEGLSQFGPRFLSHLKMKTLTNDRLSKVSLVDTPGMIDSADQDAHRGFNFQGVVRWFAERADLIMLFFDPERPGTTAETLQIYTQSLRDFDHKLLVILNKVDQFRKLSDFARCYGTLCWNLGKVMQTKDLPQIYVTYLPIDGVPPSLLPVQEFEKARSTLVKKMEQTALQRVDNILTDVTIYLDRILLHTHILDSARRWLSALRVKVFGGVITVSALFAGWTHFMSDWAPSSQYAAIAGTSIGLLIIGLGLIKGMTRHRERWSRGHLLELFEQYATDHRVRNDRYEHLKSQWTLIGQQTVRALNDLGIARLPKVKPKESREIQHWMDTRLPELRRRVHLAEDSEGTNPSSLTSPTPSESASPSNRVTSVRLPSR
jgi:GTPase SAR1 family protein